MSTDDLIFAPEPDQALPDPGAPVWHVLVVDDNPEVLSVTRLALGSYQFDGRDLVLYEAFSAQEALTWLKKPIPFAVAILDVVMETHNAGLDLVRVIREDLGQNLIRLIIRTGQPGDFPEHTVISNYDINDYWEKTELTMRKMQASLTACLRNYRDLQLIQNRSDQLRNWADRLPELLSIGDWSTLVRVVLDDLQTLYPQHRLSSLLCRNDGRAWPLVSGRGRFPAEGAPDVLPYLNEEGAGILLDAWQKHGYSENSGSACLYFETSVGEGFLLLIDVPETWGSHDRALLRLVFQNFRTILENRSLIHNLERRKNDLNYALQAQDERIRDLQHKMKNSLQIFNSLIEMESSAAEKVSPFFLNKQLRRSLQVFILTTEHVYDRNWGSSFDLDGFLKDYLDQERRHLDDQNSRYSLDYWGVPVEFEVQGAFAFGLWLHEVFTVILASARNGSTAAIQLNLESDPRRLLVKVPGLDLPLSWTHEATAPLAAQLLRLLADQCQAQFQIVSERGSSPRTEFRLEW